MAKIKPPDVGALNADAEEFLNVLSDESDLAIILVAAGYIDAAVAGLLTKVLCESDVAEKLLAPSAALAGFVARTDLAFALGLITRVVRDDLRTIAKIRNRAAHNHLKLDFDDASTRDL